MTDETANVDVIHSCGPSSGQRAFALAFDYVRTWLLTLASGTSRVIPQTCQNENDVALLEP